jgi:hypothetical protein
MWNRENLLALLEVKARFLGLWAHSLIKVYKRKYIYKAIPYKETNLPAKHVSLEMQIFTVW